MKILTTITATSVAALLASSASAASIDVLWTAGTANYNSQIEALASSAGSYDPNSDGSIDWNITMWDGTYDPGFANYDVLVVGSTCNVTGTGDCGGRVGFYGTGVKSDGVLSYGAEIAAARGSRTFLSGQDADWHHTNNRQNQDDGPKGFLINAVNWASTGSGLGVVSMVDRVLNDNGWWTATNSFLAGEIGSTVFHHQSETVTIGAGQENFPVNEGLTDAGLSNWRTSSHACFDELAGYTRINFAPHSSGSDCGVTLVTAGLEDGGTDGGDEETPVVPLPATGWLMIAALGGLAAARKRS